MNPNDDAHPDRLPGHRPADGHRASAGSPDRQPCRSARWQPRRGTDLAASTSARAWARRALPHLLEQPASDALTDDVELLLSELCTNAVQHGDGLDEVHLRCTPTTLRVTVSDHSPEVPALPDRGATDPDAHTDHGRGILLVQAIAALWGVDRHPDDGKDVWFELPIHRPPAQR